MPTKRVENPQEIYQIKITLLGTSPPIWRRLQVPANLTLEQLHDVLQLAMGWEDCHMHDFRIGRLRLDRRSPRICRCRAKSGRSLRCRSEERRVGKERERREE